METLRAPVTAPPRSEARVTLAVSAFAMAAAACVSACAPPDGSGDGRLVPLLSLSAEPFLSIGLVEGDQRYTFDEVTSVLRRPDGGVLVADGGATEITVYDADGTFVRRWGRRGEGPGELRALSGIHPHGADSILAFDPRGGRVTVFGTDGGFGRRMDAADLSADSVFRLDVWLYGRFWVHGALRPAERERVRRVLGRLPPPREAPGYRFVRVARGGTLWVREPERAPDGARRWTVLDAAGRPTGVVRLPARFAPLHIDGDEVLGRWLGPSDVAFVRAYRVEDTGVTGPAPAWLAAPRSSAVGTTGSDGIRGGDGGPSGPSPDTDELLSLIRGAIRSMASAQEIHYSRAGSYTTLVDSLDWERPEGIVADFVAADRRGWAAAFTHPTVDRVCGLGYGAATPPGWRPGSILCAPVPAPAAPADGVGPSADDPGAAATSASPRAPSEP